MNLYILNNFNNYYNRIVKYFNNINDYPQAHYILTNTNFVPNDNVNTQQTIGSNVLMYDGKGDYLLAVNEFNVIVSRWFIIESKRDRAGQYTLSLRRDLVADYYEQVIDSPMFIEKAILLSDNNLIFNSEQMTFNQIKQSETLIKDKSGCPWIVGYYAKNISIENLQGDVDVNNLDNIYNISIDVPFAEWEYNATVDNFNITPLNNTCKYLITAQRDTVNRGTTFSYNFSGQLVNREDSAFSVYNTLRYTFIDVAGTEIETLMKANKLELYNDAQAYVDFTNISDSSYFQNLNGKILKDSTNTYYKLEISQVGSQVNKKAIVSGSLFNKLSDIVLQTPTAGPVGNPGSNSFAIETTTYSYKMTATIVQQGKAKYDMTADKLITADAPYNIFAIPYGSIVLRENGREIVTSDAEASIGTANAIIKNFAQNLYDIQLLPYCPLDIVEEGYVDVLASTAYSLVKGVVEQGTEPNLTFILNIPSSRFSKNIYLDNPIIIDDAKMQSECDMYKLCSPNWASEFQFNAAKNGGVKYFNIDCEYKPYQPYIHINPNFNRLYGRDFDDARGLILSGDFSLSQISDAWEQYQIQNKNFQNIFDRQIKNMEIQNKMGRLQDILGGGVGSGTGAASGAAIGSMVAPGVGTIVGAAAGGILSLGAGVGDYFINETLRNEAIDYAKDNFGYQLGNIQALPYTLTKVSAFNNNNKIFPVLEYYTCTDTEKEALANKIAWNGMTVMAIGKMSDYIGNSWSYTTTSGEVIESQGYIKGKLIRMINDVDEDYHIVNSLAGELNKGVFIK